MQTKPLALRLQGIYQGLPAAWKTGIVAWLVPKCALTLLGFVLFWAGLLHSHPKLQYYYGIPPILTGTQAAWLGVWQRWDALHYIRIVQGGYTSNDLTAFFPLYPLLARLITELIGIDGLSALLIVSNLSFLLALVVFYKLVADLFSEQVSKGAIWCLALFPSAFFFYAVYPQSLALLFALLCFYSFRKKQLLVSIVAGIATGLTHATVIPLCLLLGVEAVRNWRNSSGLRRWIAFIPAVSPGLGVSIFLAWRFSQNFPPIFALLQSDWGRLTQWPWQTLLDLPKLFQFQYFYITGWVNLSLLALILISIFWGYQKLGLGLWIYQLSMLLFLLSSTGSQFEPLSGLNRYALLMFPTMIFLATCIKNRLWKISAITVGAILQLYLAALFFLWIWVA